MEGKADTSVTAPTPHNLTRRQFLFALAGVATLSLPAPTKAAIGLYEPFSFGYVTDCHLVNGARDTFVMLQESQLFLQDVVKSLNQQKPDFVIFGGDQVEHPGRDDTNWQLFLDVVQGLSMPWSFVLGEQEVSGSQIVDKMRTYGPDWKGKGIDTTTPYWSQSPLPGVHLIGLDTSRANSTAGDISTEQLEWLKNDLVKNSRRFTIAFSHHPLLPPAPFDGGPPWDEYTVPQGANAREILSSSKYVRLALSGHVHVSKVQKEANIWYVSNPSLSVYPCAYRIFRVTPEQVTIETYQVQFPALIKKARQQLASSTLAFKYSENKPDTYAELAAGTRLDWNCAIDLGPDAAQHPVQAARHRKKETTTPASNAEPAKGRRHKKTDQVREKPAAAKEPEPPAAAPEKDQTAAPSGDTSQ